MTRFHEKGDIEEGAGVIMNECIMRWKREHMMDDITFVLLFLDLKSQDDD